MTSFKKKLLNLESYKILADEIPVHAPLIETAEDILSQKIFNELQKVLLENDDDLIICEEMSRILRKHFIDKNTEESNI